MELPLQFGLLIFLLACSGFFSAAETALFTIGPLRLHRLAESGEKVFLTLEKLRADPHRLLTTILIGNNVVNIGASSMATAVAMEFSPGNAVGLATGVMTLLILIFGEVFPKSLATRHNVLLARWIVPPISLLVFVLSPLVRLLDFIPRLIGGSPSPMMISEADVISAVSTGIRQGSMTESAGEMLTGVLRLDDQTVRAIMTPRPDVFRLDLLTPLDIASVLDSGYSRIPAVEGDFDHLRGILYLRDLLSGIALHGQIADLTILLHEPRFVPETMRIDRLLEFFRRNQEHMAVVIDEHGSVVGIVTLEDVLEEIVGEIQDETDEETPSIRYVESGVWLLDGSVPLEELERNLSWSPPRSADYDTVAGLIMDYLGRIPAEQESIEIDDWRLTVCSLEGVRIREVELRGKLTLEDSPETGPAESDAAPVNG